MINEIHSDLIRGHIDTIILKVLFEGDRYGYEICKDIMDKCNGQYSLKQPTLYSCLKRLEKNGFISSYWGGANAKGGRRKYYTLTEQGKDLFVKNKTEWEYSRSVINRLISERDFDLGALPPIEDIKSQPPEAEEVEVDESVDFDAAATTNEAEPELEVLLTDEFEQAMVENLVQNQNQEIDENLAEFERALTMPKTEGKSYAQFLSEQEYEVCYIKPRPSFSNYNDNLNIEDRVEEAKEEDLPPYIEDYEDEDKIVQQIISDYRRPRYEQKQQIVVPPTEEELAKDYINKEYKNIIGRIFGQKSYTAPATTVPDTSFEIKKSSYQRVGQPQPPNADTVKPTKRLKKEPPVEKVADLKYRQHSKKISEQYYNAFYYFSAKLRLMHYGILFALMLIEIATAFLVIKFTLNITQENEWQYYIFSVILSACFPIFAGIMYLKNADAKLRYNFSLKNSLFLRLMIMIYVIMGAVLLNFLIFNRTANDPSTYMVSLVMPILMSVNIPISAIIFSLLYHTKKFSA